MFSEDYVASRALAKYKEDLCQNCSEDEFTVKMTDRGIVPDYFGVFHFHARYVEKKYGKITRVDAYQRAMDKVKQYNERHGMELTMIAQAEKGDHCCYL